MSSKELNDRFSALENHIAELLIRYIDSHKDPMEHPSDYSLDVHSFCILSHAAFEEFIEDVTLYSVDRIEMSLRVIRGNFLMPHYAYCILMIIRKY